MVCKMYSIVDVDSKENKFNVPFYSENDVLAIRQFNSSMKSVPDELKSKFKLYFVGSFDTCSGTIVGIEPMEVLIDENI